MDAVELNVVGFDHLVLRCADVFQSAIIVSNPVAHHVHVLN